MSGLGLANVGHCRGGGGSRGGYGVRKGMGIQFVKSSEPLHSESQLRASSAVSEAPLSRPHSSPGGSAVTPLLPTPSSSHNYSNHPSRSASAGRGTLRFGQAFVRSEVKYAYRAQRSAEERNGYKMPGYVNLSKGASQNSFAPVPEAKPLLTKEGYYALWKNEKDPLLQKFRKLAYEVMSLKSDRPNAKDKLHSAANRVPIRIEFNTEPVFGTKNNNSFLCYVFVEGITVASGQGVKIKDSKTNAYEAALQKILMHHLRIIQLDPESKELQVSQEPFAAPAPEPSKVPLSKSSARLPPSLQSSALSPASSQEVASQHKESNLEAACLKRRFNQYKPLEEFVIVEPLIPIPDCTPAHTLRRSADFNHMLLEYDYFFRGEAARCVLRIENQVLSDVNGVSKVAAKNNAAAQALTKLKQMCWVIKTKKAVDSNTKISKEELLHELNEQSDAISHDNIGNKMLRKMGWSGGGVGKDGSGIAEPVVLKSVFNREGLGLSAQKGITDEFKKRVREVIENYASSENQEDLVFACDFRLDERQIIHDECRRLNLRSKSRGKGQQRYLCVRRKRSANQLFNHIMSSGGETARYVLVPPGTDRSTPQAKASSGSQSGGDGAGPKPLMSLSIQQKNVSQGRVSGGFQGRGAVHKQDSAYASHTGSNAQPKAGRFHVVDSNQGSGMQNVGIQPMRNQWNGSHYMGATFHDCWMAPVENGQAVPNMASVPMGMQNGQIGMQTMGIGLVGGQNIAFESLAGHNMESSVMAVQAKGNGLMGRQTMGGQTLRNGRMGYQQNHGNDRWGVGTSVGQWALQGQMNSNWCQQQNWGMQTDFGHGSEMNGQGEWNLQPMAMKGNYR